MGNFSNVNEFMDEIQVSELMALHKPKQPHWKKVALANCGIYTP
jgi:hypothetical protein